MVIVCAWCKKYLGHSEPLAEACVTHTICDTCRRRREWSGPATLVVTRERAQLAPVLRELLHGEPAIEVVVDRRDESSRDSPAIERRRGAAKRQPFDLLLG